MRSVLLSASVVLLAASGAGCGHHASTPDAGDASEQDVNVPGRRDTGPELCTGATAALGEACGCDTDCSAGVCTDGVCFLSCLHSACPTGFSCDGRPLGCRRCNGGTPVTEGGDCACDADCTTGLSCLGGFCLRACTGDESCGADECRHLSSGPATCDAPAACDGLGATGPGQDCACNADCGPSAPFCLGVVVGSAFHDTCSAECSPMMPCPTGTQCCSTVTGYDFCMSSAVATEAGATCF